MTGNMIQFLINPSRFCLGEAQTYGDILIITGDLKTSLHCDDIISWASENFSHTYIVMGNKDYYDGTDVADTLLAYKVSVLPNVSFINNISVLISDMEIFFTTLWKPYIEQDISNMLSDREDFDHIRCNGHLLTLEMVGQLNEVCKQWLLSSVARSNSGRRIVVTHHAMSDDLQLYHTLISMGVDEIVTGDGVLI